MKKSTSEQPIKSARVRREEAISALPHDQLLNLTISLSRQIQEAKQYLRIAARTFRWVQKPAEAQDIEKFLDKIGEKKEEQQNV